MRRTMRIVWLLLLVGLATAASHQPHPSGGNCAQTCSGLSSELHYDDHIEYLYDVSSTANLDIGHGNPKTTVTQRSRAHITKHSPCEFSLKLTGASLSGMDVPRDWSRVLESHPLRFGFDDGQVVAVCPTDDDPVWAVNLKRAVLSTFQTMHDSDWESDVIGDCPVDRENQRRGSSLSITTTKDVGACQRGYDVAGVRAIPYTSKSKIQAGTPMHANQKCVREVRDGVLQRATCTETHQIQPPEASSPVLSSHIEQTMAYSNSHPSNAQSPAMSKHETITFDHSEDKTKSKATPQEAKANIDVLCHSQERVETEAASAFAHLVASLRGLTQSEISSVARRDCEAFLDAVATCATADCMAHLSTVINHGNAPESVFSSLALVHKPCKKVVDHVASFIEKVPTKGLLGVSSLVQSFCLSHPNCGQEQGVKRIVESLTAKIHRGCQIGNVFADVEKAVYVLKALGNIGHEEISLPRINECIVNEHNSLEVQLSAIDALRRKPCGPQRNQHINKLFFDEKEDEEVRIAAFEQLMHCPDEVVVEMIIEHLHNETSNQVGSYVCSYLNAKKRSSDPTAGELQRILKKEHIPQRFNLDPRRFSRFYEFDYYDPEDNLGGKVDTSIVFSPKGYVPRGVSVNFTVHLFGKDVNVFEVGARTEGLEQADNDMFGADGYISNPNGHVFREKKMRSHYDKLNQMKVLYLKKGDFVEDQVSGSMYWRMYGDDLKYCAFEQNHFFEKLKQYMDLDKVLPKMAKELKYAKSRNMMLVDAHRTLPTICGLPIQIGLEAALSSNVQYKAKLNLVDLLHQKPDAQALLEARPSASVYGTSHMALLAAGVKSGMRYESTFHTATAISAEVSLSNGKQFTAKVTLPDDDATLALVETKASIIDHNGLHVLHPPSGGQEHRRCTSGTSGKVTGLKLCAEGMYQLPFMKAAITLEKVDPRLKSYQMTIERENHNGHQKLLMSVDTPGSKVNRKMETNFEFSIPQKKIKMDVITPFKKISIDGNLEERKRLEDYGAKVKMNIDDRHHYDLDGAFKAGMENGRKKYTLSAKSRAGSAHTADLHTEVLYSGRNSPYASIDFNLDKVFDKPVVLKTMLNLGAPSYETKLEYSGPQFNGKLEGNVMHKALMDLKGELKGDYQIGNQQKHVLSVGAEQTFSKQGMNHKFVHSVNVETSSLGKLKYKVYSKSDGKHMQNALEVTRGNSQSGINVDINRGANQVYTGLITAKCNTLGLNHKANVVYQNNFPLQFQLKVDGETPTMKGLHASVEYHMKSDPKWNFDGKGRLAYPGKEMTLSNHIDEVQKGTYKMNTMVQWDRNSKLDLKSDILYKPALHEYSIESVANVPGLREPIQFKKYASYHGDNYKIHWRASHGRVLVYELIGDTHGKFGAPQKFSFEVKSEQTTPRINYHMTGDVHPSSDAIQMNGVVQKDGHEIGKGSLLVPRSFRAHSQKYRSEFDWKYENKPHKAIAEFVMNKDAGEAKHTLTIEGDRDKKMVVQFDIANSYDRMHLKYDIAQEGRTVSTSDYRIGPVRWNHFEFDGHSQAGRHTVKTKAVYQYEHDNVDVRASLDFDGQPFNFGGKWKKQREGRDQRHYTYSAIVHTPKGGFDVEQQLRVERGFTIRKAHTQLKLTAGSKHMEIMHNAEGDQNSVKSDTSITSNGGTNIKHKLDYKHIGGRRTVKVQAEFNGVHWTKEMETVYQDREVKVHFALTSSLHDFKSMLIHFECDETTYWNCKVEGNVNDKYIVKGHESVSPQKSDVGYVLRLGNFANNEGKLEYDVDKRASKYKANAELLNFDKKYNMEMNVDRDRGSFKIKTPSQLITDAQLHVTRRGQEEFEVTTQTSGVNQGKVHAHIKTADNDQMFDLKVTEIKEPFELLVKSTESRGKQITQVEVTLDPLRTKKTYGVENVIESEAGKFRALRTTLKHPKRTMHFELLRPSQNKYSFTAQPNVGSRRRPTVMEMTYDKKASGYHWEGSLADEHLRSPIKAKIDLAKTGHDEHNYGLNIKTELDYSGQPDKLVTHSLRIERKAVTLHRRRRNAGRDATFEAEFIASQPSSNLHTRLWAKVDRKNVDGKLIPVHTTFGAELKDAHKQLIEYSLGTESDAKSFMEMKATAPGTNLKTRVQAVNNKHFKIAFYRNSDRASMTGEMKIAKGVAELDLRDEKSGNVMMHASASMPNDYSAEIELWHSQAGKRVRDVRLAIELEESNLLRTKMYVRPQLERDLTSTAKQALAKAKHLDKDAALKEAVIPAIHKHQETVKDVMDNLKTLFKAWANEQRLFANELGPEYKQLVDSVEEHYEMLEETVLTTYDLAQQSVEQAIATLSHSGVIAKLRELRSGSGDMSRQLSSVLQSVSDAVNMYSSQLSKLQKPLNEAIKYLEKNLKIDELRVALREYKSNLDHIDIVREILFKLRQLGRKYQLPAVERQVNDIERNREEYETKLNHYYEKVQDMLLEEVAVKTLTGLTNAVVDRITDQTLDNEELEKRWNDVIQFLRGKISTDKFSQNLWKKYVPSVQRTGPGEYMMEVTVPHGATSLYDIVDDLHPERLAALKSSLLEKARGFGSDLAMHGSGMDSIYSFKSSLKDRGLPPFESYAYIVAPDRFITFDGRAFPFHAACDYVLATDFIDLQFALVATFSPQRGGAAFDSIKAEIRGDNIVMHINGKVEVGGSPVAMPYQKVDSMDGASLVSVHREGDWTILESYLGVGVKCNSKLHICEIKLPGRMHGRSHGLLGSNDNEPSNDLHLLDGTYNDQTDKLAEHWAVRGSCRRNEAQPLRDHEDEKCESMFLSSGSQFSDCFSQIHPARFDVMCSGSQPGERCSAASAFVLACNNRGVDVSLPDQCVHCEDDTKLHEQKRVENPHTGHDIVFVVEERACLDPYRNKIAHLAQSLARNQRNARLGWVGFGGEGVKHEPRIHYERDEALLDVQSFSRQAQTKFETDSGFEPKPMCSLVAAQFAATHFPFRLASEKSIVLVTCKPCTGSHQISQSELLDALLEQGITMHTISLARIKAGEGIRAVAMDADNLYDERGSHVGDRSAVKQPNDVCSVVAQESHGLVFNIKHGMNVASSKITPREGEHCQLCQCEVHHLCVHNVCRPCHPIKPASMESANFSGKVSDDHGEITLDEMSF